MIVLGCAGMADLAARLSESHGLPVIDGVASAVKLGEAFGALGLKTSKIGAYALPRPKAYLGAICILRTTLENRSASERPYLAAHRCWSRLAPGLMGSIGGREGLKGCPRLT